MPLYLEAAETFNGNDQRVPIPKESLNRLTGVFVRRVWLVIASVIDSRLRVLCEDLYKNRAL
jgi:hypothetical protein